MYSTHNEEPRTFINDILPEETFFEAIIKDDENMSLKNKCLFGGWILMASKVYRKEDLSHKFEDWLCCLCKIKKKQTSYNYGNLSELMSAAAKLVNTTYFVKNYEILLNCFNDLETQTPCTCEDCISYFDEPTTA